MSSFVKEKSTQMVSFMVPRLGSWQENLAELACTVFYFYICVGCSAINSKVYADIVWDKTTVDVILGNEKSLSITDFFIPSSPC